MILNVYRSFSAYEATIKSRNIGPITADYEVEISRVYKARIS